MCDTIAPDLAQYYNEMQADGVLSPSMLLGEIVLLYKKKDPCDVAPQLQANHAA